MHKLSTNDFISLGEKPKEYFYDLPHEAIKHCLVKEEPEHNAIWDMKISPDGRIFFSVCAELTESQYVRLYEYLPDENKVKLHFRFEDVVISRDREIRASKFHTSMAFMNDGRMIMATHTTARAPQHPTWMPESYYHHLWEGYPGSTLLIYDPDTGVVENRGILVPHESIYGGTYDKKHNVYYFGGMIRGHAYSYDLNTNRVEDLGQVTEYGAYYWCVGPDDHIYSSSHRGRLFRINVDTRKIEDLGCTFERCADNLSLIRNQLNNAHTGPDGKLYMQIAVGDKLYRFDCDTLQLENVGSYLPENFTWPHIHWMVGLYFDADQVLWYCLFLFNNLGESSGCRLCSWDILHGGKPQDHGIIGSDLRAVHCLSEVAGKDDRLFVCDGNHLFDCVGMVQIDLKELRKSEKANVQRVMCHDVAPYLSVKGGLEQYPYDDGEALSDTYLSYMDRLYEHRAVCDVNQEVMRAKSCRVVTLWDTIGFDMPVQALEWQTDGSLIGFCGKEKTVKFTIADHKLQSFESAEYPAAEEPIALPQQVKLPCVPGRQYLAQPSAAVTMHDGSCMVGTKDGMLCKVIGERVYSLGMACFNGPIHQLTTDQEGKVVYGVAGHEMDLGMIFQYDDENGLQWRGRNFVTTDTEPYSSGSTQPVCCALSPDGEWLAVGVADRMSCVYLYQVG